VPLVSPMLQVVSLPVDLPPPDKIQAILITSSNALEAGQNLAALFDRPCFCVGERTAARALAAGFRKVHSAASDGMELAQLITASLSGRNSGILHIAGLAVDSRAQDELARRGHRVHVWPVYAARPVMALSEHTTSLLKRQSLDAVLFFSSRTAEIFRALVDKNGLNPCCRGLTAIGLSETVIENLRTFPWKHLVAAAMPTEDAVIDCLQQVFPVP